MEWHHGLKLKKKKKRTKNRQRTGKETMKRVLGNREDGDKNSDRKSGRAMEW